MLIMGEAALRLHQLPTTPTGVVRFIFGVCMTVSLIYVGRLERGIGSRNSSSIDAFYNAAVPRKLQANLGNNGTTATASTTGNSLPTITAKSFPTTTSTRQAAVDPTTIATATAAENTISQVNPEALVVSELTPENSFKYNNSLGACLLIMDDTIKLTEWLAYHYTVVPLSHLIVVIDPASTKTPQILEVLELYQTRMYIEVWTKDASWMNLEPQQGWNYPKDYANFLKNNKTDLVKRKIHARRQNHFVYRCNARFRELKQQQHSSNERRRIPSFVLHIDSDEFLTYNYYDNATEHPESINENNRGIKEWKRNRRERMIRKGREAAIPIRSKMPPMNSLNYTLADFVVDHFSSQTCIMIVGLKFSTQESNWTNVMHQVPHGIDARKLHSLRYRFHESKHGGFNKVMFNVDRLTRKGDWDSTKARTIHNPMPSRCFENAPAYAGFDYQWSILRLHHYVGSYEAFAERAKDSRGARKTDNDRKAAYKGRKVPDDKLEGPNDDLRSWITMFVHHRLGGNVTEARRLLSPLDVAYDEQSFEGVWNASIPPNR